VQSEEGNGSAFRVFFPAGAHPQASEQLETRPVVLPRGNGETILVVDDDESIRTIASTILERHGYRVQTAANGAEAVALYRKRAAEISVVLTDMAMPVMDGAAAVAALKAINPGLRIVCCSGLASGTDLAMVQALGVRHFVPKPYTAETILATIRKALDEQPA
jgi:CheY-like chemotaxis protein